MPPIPHIDPGLQATIESVYRLFRSLALNLDPETGLGGKLLYAGELHEDGCRLVRAANVAGAASLGATADPNVLRRANREGVVDFLVNSLDEALRILKNEVRKRQAVSVAVAAAPSAMVAEMVERGVLPDLLPPVEWETGSALVEFFQAHGASRVEINPLPDGHIFLAWDKAPPDFETLALELLPQDDFVNRCWLRVSPRYLGPMARRVRSLACTPESAERLAKIGPSHSA